MMEIINKLKLCNHISKKKKIEQGLKIAVHCLQRSDDLASFLISRACKSDSLANFFYW